ncbi:troponin I, fast skeletal muscle-like [Genypterus blacodes]|uniref:troponin I, fast skeletal muscle-like n=1 Tax=Genypterus blacodes TaxID=154954 RepID=UPI003F763473
MVGGFSKSAPRFLRCDLCVTECGSYVNLTLFLPNRKKLTNSRRHHLKSLILGIAASWLEQEKKEAIAAKEAHMAEHCPKADTSGDHATLMETCKKLHALIDQLDEERYDTEAKVMKGDIERRH